MCEHEIDIVAIQKTHNFSFEFSEQRQTTRIQTDWRYTQQRSCHSNVRQRYFSGLGLANWLGLAKNQKLLVILRTL
jgi:hypothetical protein